MDGSCKSCGTFRALAVMDPTFLEWRPGGRGYRDRLTTRPHHWTARPDRSQSIPCDREAHSGLDGKGHGSVRQIGGRIMELLSRCMGRVPLPDDQGSRFQAGSQTQVLTFSADSRSCCSIGRLRFDGTDHPIRRVCDGGLVTDTVRRACAWLSDVRCKESPEVSREWLAANHPQTILN